MELREMTKIERDKYLENLHEQYKSLSKEERKKLKYFELKNEAELIDLSEKFLEKIDDTPITEELLKKKSWLLKNITVSHGYIGSEELKTYLLEHYSK